MPLYICGFVLLGASLQNHLSVGALVMGWGIAEVAIMINTVAICWCMILTQPLISYTSLNCSFLSLLQMHIAMIVSRPGRSFY